MEKQTRSGLTAVEMQDLQCVAGVLIPSSAEFGVPGADDPVIFADIVASLGRDLGEVRLALAELALLARSTFAAVDEAEREALAIEFYSQSGEVAETLGRTLLQCYYRDERVIRALGLAPGPPFPRGRTLDQGDWSLLEPVSSMPPLWRDDRQR